MTVSRTPLMTWPSLRHRSGQVQYSLTSGPEEIRGGAGESGIGQSHHPSGELSAASESDTDGSPRGTTTVHGRFSDGQPEGRDNARHIGALAGSKHDELGYRLYLPLDLTTAFIVLTGWRKRRILFRLLPVVAVSMSYLLFTSIV